MRGYQLPRSGKPTVLRDGPICERARGVGGFRRAASRRDLQHRVRPRDRGSDSPHPDNRGTPQSGHSTAPGDVERRRHPDCRRTGLELPVLSERHPSPGPAGVWHRHPLAVAPRRTPETPAPARRGGHRHAPRRHRRHRPLEGRSDSCVLGPLARAHVHRRNRAARTGAAHPRIRRPASRPRDRGRRLQQPRGRAMVRARRVHVDDEGSSWNLSGPGVLALVRPPVRQGPRRRRRKSVSRLCRGARHQ
jgi:hypothetical protein